MPRQMRPKFAFYNTEEVQNDLPPDVHNVTQRNNETSLISSALELLLFQLRRKNNAGNFEVQMQRTRLKPYSKLANKVVQSLREEGSR